MPQKRFLFYGAIILVGAGAGWFACRPQPRLKVESSPSPSKTIAASGKILGLGIGTSIQEAREKLDPLRVPAVYTPDRKEQNGRRILWRLKETDYDWIMAWADAKGRITRMRAVFRPEKMKPFREIGNLQTAANATKEAAKWNLQGADGSRFRLIAQGAAERAQTVYMFELEPFGREQPDADQEPEDD